MMLQGDKYLQKNDGFTTRSFGAEVIPISEDKKIEQIICDELFISTITKFPYNKPLGHIFQHKKSDYIFTIMANHKFGLPYGAQPRLFLISIINEIQETKSPVLNIEKIYSKLLSNLNRLNYENEFKHTMNLYDQMLKLFSSYVSCSYRDQFSNEFFAFDFWQIPLKSNKISNETTIILSKDLFEKLLLFPFLVDFKILQNIYHSPMQIDIYVWLMCQCSRLQNKTLIPWSHFINQFNSDYAVNDQALEDFKNQLMNMINIISKANSHIKISLYHDGLLLFPLI